MSSNTASSSYVTDHLPPSIVEKLEAGAFRSLCTHLRERSDAVSNMELMTLSGFCRNCLAKWMVLEARKFQSDQADIQIALDAMGYPEAAEYVYGIDYNEWKKRHMTKASEEQMERFHKSKPLWAQHDKDLLQVRGEKPQTTTFQQDTTRNTTTSPSSLLSNVCCQDVNQPTIAEPTKPTERTVTTVPTPNVPQGGVEFTIGILTVSDRAAKKEYSTGDLSGPAVADAVESTLEKLNSTSTEKVVYQIVQRAIVPDDHQEIQNKLQEWIHAGIHLILTTGGTGFSPRDVTPEATKAVVSQTSHGLMAFCLTECSLHQQPLASLSRGIVGVANQSIICNLPGNPRGVHEIVPILLPLVLYAIQDLLHDS